MASSNRLESTSTARKASGRSSIDRNDYQTTKEESMAVDLRCPNCLDNLGKDKENLKKAWCGTCGTEFDNPYGYEEEVDDV